MGMPGIFEILIIAGICAVPVLIAAVVIIAVVANVKRK